MSNQEIGIWLDGGAIGIAIGATWAGQYTPEMFGVSFLLILVGYLAKRWDTIEEKVASNRVDERATPEDVDDEWCCPIHDEGNQQPRCDYCALERRQRWVCEYPGCDNHANVGVGASSETYDRLCHDHFEEVAYGE